MKYLRAVQFFLGTLAIYLVPPLLGWGVDDLPGFFSLYPRLGYAALMVILLMYGMLIFLPFADRRHIGVLFEDQVMRWPGLILAAFGFALIFWSGLALGKLYSADVTIQKNHHLVTIGPYRYIRHPRYLGGILFAIGFPLLFRSWIGLAGSMVFLGVLLFRIEDEEALLHQEFGQEWETYCQQSWRFIPYLY